MIDEVFDLLIYYIINILYKLLIKYLELNKVKIELKQELINHMNYLNVFLLNYLSYFILILSINIIKLLKLLFLFYYLSTNKFLLSIIIKSILNYQIKNKTTKNFNKLIFT